MHKIGCFRKVFLQIQQGISKRLAHLGKDLRAAKIVIAAVGSTFIPHFLNLLGQLVWPGTGWTEFEG